MTPVYAKTIEGPSACPPTSIGGEEGRAWTLADRPLAALDDLLRRTRGLKMEAIKRGDFDHPALTPFLSDIRDEVMNGKCAVILRGLDPKHYSQADCERLFCG